ncbi:fibrous sheath CABYR-binding protein isoform X1 [Oncorhynchus tshawytscha]|uniref:fibrous sheath CABYR-binding protein isoform X1 n=2 Tax=Oncorhynchus tshawytscha TaxID=74940 RepID=UPI000D09B3CA|nr:fibrous sheath CABYR-binding protein isoform X1 [Oncorhynchus tshawytscha]
MVAGMVMPLADLRAIYELLFLDGVMVAKKDRRPQCMHPEIQGVANLKVIRAMGSLKSKGFVRETFAWKHSYWYLTNEGIVYLRDYLRLPPEIVPSSLQRVRRPASTLNMMRRASRGVVQTVEGPPFYAPKPRVGQESQQGMIDRQGYRHKRGLPGEEEASGVRLAMRFRGSYQGHGRGAVGEPGAETQTFFRRGQGFHREQQHVPEEGQRRGFAPRGPAYPPPLEARPVRSPAPAGDVKPFVPEVPAPAPIKQEKTKEVAVLVPFAEIIEPAFIPAVEPEAPALELEKVMEEVTVEEVSFEAPMPVEEAEPQKEEITAVEAAEVLSDVWEQEEPKPVVEKIEEAAEKAPEPEVGEAIKEDVLEATAPVEEFEEEPKQSTEGSAEESIQESTEEVEDVVENVTATEMVVVEEAAAIQAVVVRDAPEVPPEDHPHDTDIEIFEEPKEVEEEPSTHEEPEASLSEASSDSEASEPEPITAAVATEAESEPVTITEIIEAESEPATTTENIEAESEPATTTENIEAESEPATTTENIEAESEPSTTTEGAVEAKSKPVTITEAIPEVKASVPLTKSDSTEPDSDTDLPTPLRPVTEDFTDLTEYHQQTVLEHITQEIPAGMAAFRSEMPLEVTSQVVSSTVYSTVFENQISQSEAFMEPPSIGMAGTVSQLGLEQEASPLFGAECTAPVIPSECPIAPSECPVVALKSSLPQDDWAFLTEEPDEEVKKIWPDALQGQ